MSLNWPVVGSRATRGRNWSPRSRNLCSEGRATGHVLFSRMTSRKGAPTLPRGARTANSTSRLDLSIEHLVRAPLASHRLGLDLFLWSTKSCCPLRAGTSLCSAPKVRRQDPAGESNPPRLSPGGVGAAAATAGEHGRLPRGARRRKKRHERRTLKRPDTRFAKGPWVGG